MAGIHTRSLEEVVGTLPDVIPFSESFRSGKGNALAEVTLADPELHETADLFLCALGFEPRCLSVPEALAQQGFRARRTHYFQYSTNRDDNSVHLSRLLQLLEGFSPGEVRSIEVDEDAFSSYLQGLLSSYGASDGSPPLVVMDISVASDRLLMRCLKELFERDIRLRLFYSEAHTYFPTRDQFEGDPEKWCSDEQITLERGVREVRISHSQPGHHTDQTPDCVILFPSFKKDRACAVLSHVDPALLVSPGPNVVWLLGTPHLEEDHWRLDAMRAINGLNSPPFASCPQYEVSTFDYKDALRRLESIHGERCTQFRFTLSVMGSKMQVVGASLFCHLHPDVKVVFVTPKVYNASQYSSGCKQIWSLDLGDTQALRRSLGGVGMLYIE